MATVLQKLNLAFFFRPLFFALAQNYFCHVVPVPKIPHCTIYSACLQSSATTPIVLKEVI